MRHFVARSVHSACVALCVSLADMNSHTSSSHFFPLERKTATAGPGTSPEQCAPLCGTS
ncbi:hypothetical protein LF41_738 [Lysobacter dokdonensis DS-58]|uniref:Uncharacterized protein n=1 Tax=Lysobacter dokdonensis DS-58 TaxID=1300345 RepID=A0A0A2WFB3_9GAMM|nr:hypothetical protein LF41_738 [Lysobacter dokdonensis DS-58]